MESSNNNILKKNLDEISFIRPILIVLLVLYHSFAPWCGGWGPIVGCESNEVYWWIGESAYSFMLPMFVFVSGYVWSYQREILQKKDSFKQLVTKKFKRLYVPSLIFSTAYFLIFHRVELVMGGGNQLITTLMHIISGYGHMWFLPMLFWTFVFTYCILLIKKRWIRWCVVIALNIFSLVPIPLELSASFNYILFFYAGYEILLWHTSRKKSYSSVLLVLSWLIFVLLFVTLLKMNESVIGAISNSGLIRKAIGLTIAKINRNIYSIAGIVALLISAYKYTSKKKLNSFTIKIGEYCFGVYLFQQFILIALYYYTNLPSVIGTNLLPWCGFIITLIISLLLSSFIRETKIGKNLI